MSDYGRNFCPNCGSKVAPGATACNVCGAQLVDQAEAYTPPAPTPTYQSGYVRTEEEGLDAAQALVLCCFGSPATGWVIYKSLGYEKKAYHACIIFFLPMIAGVVIWILAMILLLPIFLSGFPYGYY
ncbi:MAG: zinc ribbon domain-containing protein [Candidatus Hermodarchaeota archaeon]